jgi:hypothetical protein
MRSHLHLALAATIGGILLPGPAAAAPGGTRGFAIMAAEVAGTGVLTGRNTGAVSATKIVTGFYHVTFNRNVDRCTAIVNSRISSFASAIQLGPESPSGFGVTVRSSEELPVDEAFHMLVFCWQ